MQKIIQNLKNTSYTNEQKQIASRIIDILTKNGYEPFVYDDEIGCRLDICVEVGVLKHNQYTIGRFGIFWNTNRIAYLGSGENHSDGYEIKRKWQDVTDINDIVKIYEEDVRLLKIYHERQLK